jgi:hypothetical protein
MDSQRFGPALQQSVCNRSNRSAQVYLLKGAKGGGEGWGVGGGEGKKCKVARSNAKVSGRSSSISRCVCV